MADKADSVIFKGEDNRHYEKIENNEPVLLENLPFEIPNSWVWARLGNHIDLLLGRDLAPSQYNDNHKGIPYITGASNFSNGDLIVNRWTEMPVVISHIGDLLITCKGTIGEMAYNRIGDIHIARQTMAIYTHDLYIGYIKLFLESYVQHLQSIAKSFIPGISRCDLNSALIPIPPLNEQTRIVNKIQQILASIGKCKT